MKALMNTLIAEYEAQIDWANAVLSDSCSMVVANGWTVALKFEYGDSYAYKSKENYNFMGKGPTWVFLEKEDAQRLCDRFAEERPEAQFEIINRRDMAKAILELYTPMLEDLVAKAAEMEA